MRQQKKRGSTRTKSGDSCRGFEPLPFGVSNGIRTRYRVTGVSLEFTRKNALTEEPVTPLRTPVFPAKVVTVVTTGNHFPADQAKHPQHP